MSETNNNAHNKELEAQQLAKISISFVGIAWGLALLVAIIEGLLYSFAHSDGSFPYMFSCVAVLCAFGSFMGNIVGFVIGIAALIIAKRTKKKVNVGVIVASFSLSLAYFVVATIFFTRYFH